MTPEELKQQIRQITVTSYRNVPRTNIRAALFCSAHTFRECLRSRPSAEIVSGHLVCQPHALDRHKSCWLR